MKGASEFRVPSNARSTVDYPKTSRRRPLTRLVLSVLLLMALTVAIPAVSRAEDGEDRHPLQVAFVASFSGAGIDSWAKAASEGMELGVRELSGRQMSIHYIDDRGNPERALREVARLPKEKVDVIVAFGEAGKALSDMAEKEQIPLFIWSDLPPITENRMFTFHIAVPAEAEAARIAHEASRRGYHRIAVAYTGTPYYREVIRSFRANTSPSSLVLVQEFPQGHRDFTEFVREARAARATAFGLFLEPGGSADLARAARSKFYAADYFGLDTLYSREEIRRSRDVLLGAWFATAALDNQFVRTYAHRFQSGPAVKIAAVYHDLALMLGAHVDSARDPEEFANSVSRSQISGGALEWCRFERAGSYFTLVVPLTILQATIDGFELVEKAIE